MTAREQMALLDRQHRLIARATSAEGLFDSMCRLYAEYDEDGIPRERIEAHVSAFLKQTLGLR